MELDIGTEIMRLIAKHPFEVIMVFQLEIIMTLMFKKFK